MTGDRRLVEAAFELDPLAGRGDLTETQRMVEELMPELLNIFRGR